MMRSPIILFDYDISPFGFKVRQYLAATSASYERVVVPLNPPRKDLEKLGITYGRVPVLAIGKDVYCDSSFQIAALQRMLGDKALPSTYREDVYRAWGLELRNRAVAIVPVKAFPPEMINDRARLFPALDRPTLESDMSNSLAEFMAYLRVLEGDLLKDDKPFLEGEDLSMADLHVAWAVQATFEALDIVKMRGFEKSSFPKIQAWIGRLPLPQPKNISMSEAAERISSAEHTRVVLEVDKNDPLQLEMGDRVAIEMSDDLGRSGRLPQCGELQALNINEVVIELENGIRMHFPRIGVVVRKAELPPRDTGAS